MRENNREVLQTRLLRHSTIHRSIRCLQNQIYIYCLGQDIFGV